MAKNGMILHISHIIFVPIHFPSFIILFLNFHNVLTCTHWNFPSGMHFLLGLCSLQNDRSARQWRSLNILVPEHLKKWFPNQLWPRIETHRMTYLESQSVPQKDYCLKMMWSWEQRHQTKKMFHHQREEQVPNSGAPRGVVDGRCVKVLLLTFHWQGAGTHLGCVRKCVSDIWEVRREPGRRLGDLLNDYTT